MNCMLVFVLITLRPLLGACTSLIPETKENLLPNTTICGIHNVVDQLIYGGNRTELKEFPWMALLEYKRKRSRGKNRKHLCGGALINKRYVLTAAHCLVHKNYTLINVRLGEYDVTSKTDCIDGRCAPKALSIKVQEIIIHENYSVGSINRYNDVGLVRLEKDVDFSDYVRPICLPIAKNVKESSYNGSLLTVAGWGYTEEGKMSDVKLKIELPVVDHLQCAKTYSDLGYGITLDSRQMCAGGISGKDSCAGDSGGPLMAQHLDENEKRRVNWYAAGIVSFGPQPCGIWAIPAVYIRVSYYMEWIIDKIKA